MISLDENRLGQIISEQLQSELAQGAFRQTLELELAKAFGQLSRYFDKRLKEELKPLRNQFNQMQNTLDGFVGRMSDDEVERASMANELDRHDRWIKEIADHTDTQLSPP